jgi:hypothetical protein
VAKTLVTSKFEAKTQFLLQIGATGSAKFAQISFKYPLFCIMHLMIGDIRAGVKHIANLAVPAQRLIGKNDLGP